MNDKLQEFLNIISSEKSGEGVRDALERAIISVDDTRAHVDGEATKRMALRTTTDTVLAIMWFDVIHYFPNAVQPEYDGDEKYNNPEGPMNDALRAYLLSLKASVTGIDIRRSLYLALQNVAQNIITQNLPKDYYAKRMLDLYNAFITACDDSERKETAINHLSTLSMTTMYNSLNVTETNIMSNIAVIENAKTGADARTPSHDALLYMDQLNERKQSWTEDYADYDRAIGDVSTDFEYLAIDLLTDGHGNYDVSPHYVYNAGGPYNTLNEANTVKSQVQALVGTAYTYIVAKDNIRGDYYVVLGADASTPFYRWTYPITYIFSLLHNNQFPGLNEWPLEWERYVLVQRITVNNVLDAFGVAFSMHVDLNYTRPICIRCHNGVGKFIVVLGDVEFVTEAAAQSYINATARLEECSPIILDHSGERPEPAGYQLLFGVYSAEASAIDRKDRIENLLSDRIHLAVRNLYGYWMIMATEYYDAATDTYKNCRNIESIEKAWELLHSVDGAEYAWEYAVIFGSH